MNTFQQQFFKLATSSRFKFYLLLKLPVAYLSGIKVVSINRQSCTTSLPYKYLTRNPFKSIYFASLAMAAEMATGLLAMSCIYKRNFSVSMLVIKMEASYFKKESESVCFICDQGEEINSVVEAAIHTGAAKTITVKSIGKNKNNEIVAEFLFTWSFKNKLALYANSDK